MENPGSFYDAKEKNPGLTDHEVRVLWEREVLAFQRFLSSQVEVEEVDG